MADQSIAEIYGYIPKPIDIDRGVAMRDAPDGTRVIMYKHMPGLYLDAAGRVVSAEVAEKAGFDVRGDLKEARIRDEVARTTASIRQRLLEVEHEVRSETTDEVRGRLNPLADLQRPPAVSVEVTEQTKDGAPRGTKDFQMAHKGAGKFVVLARASQTAVSDMLDAEDAVQAMLELQAQRDAG